ncbi:MAG TPA: tetratricopeptide repeat protein, partial [Spirochaetia bacterium]|nr:tetratricopeptide repeat protein [Spirochaetia bacterium]
LLHLYLAIIYRERGELKGALEQYNLALEINPDDPVILFQRAVLYHRLGETARAQAELKKLNMVQDTEGFSWESPNTDRVVAVQQFQEGKYVKAIFFAEKILHAEPKDVDMHLLVGESYRILGELEKASNHFQRVLDVDRNLLEPRYGLALIHWQRESWSDMMAELKRIERIDPGNATSGYYTALCACRLDEETEATIPALQEQIRSSGPDAFLLSALAGEYIKAGLPELSEKWYGKALKLADQHRPARLGLIHLYRELDKPDKLRESYSDYLRVFDDDPDIRRDFIHFLVDHGDFEVAAEQIQKYIPLRKGDKRLRRLLALCYRRTERYREASIIYRQLLREDPENHDNLRSLVYCMEKLDNHLEAIDLLEKAMDYLKPSASLRLIAGVLLYKAEQMDGALKHFRVVVELAKQDWRGYYNMAMVYKKQGMGEFAQKYFAKADVLKKKSEQPAAKKPSKTTKKVSKSELSSTRTRV